MSPRALAAVAVMTAALAGRAAGQYPPVPAPLGGPPGGNAFVPGDNPYFNGGMAQGAYPTEPTVSPSPYPGPAPSASVVEASAPSLPTDSLGDGTARGPKGWIGVDYLFFWEKHAPLNAVIATAGPSPGSALLGSPGTRVAVGGTEYNSHNFSGVRVNAGYWLTNNESFGIEGSLFILPQKKNGTPLVTGVQGLPILARPFFNTSTNAQSSRILTEPGVFAGGIRTDTTSTLWGADIGPVWRAIDRGGWWTLDGLAGFQYLSLEESLKISDFSSAGAGGVAVFQGRAFGSPAVTFVTDRFATTNRFCGGMVGARTNIYLEAFTFSLAAKVGVGTMQESVRVDGTSTVIGAAAVPTTSGGGFLAVGGNAGTFTRNELVAIPQLLTNMNVQVTRHLSINFGYNALYVSSVVRPGDQLNNRINSTLLPTSSNFGARFGPGQSSVPVNTTDFWAHGFNAGLAYGF